MTSMIDSPEDLREASYTAPEQFLDDDALARKILSAVTETRLETTSSGNIAFPSAHDSLTDPSLSPVRKDNGKTPDVFAGMSLMDATQHLSPTKGKETDDPKENRNATASSPNASPRRRHQRNTNDLEYCEDLVVATAVYDNMTVDSDGDGYMPTCIEFDPDSKPAEYRNAFYRRMFYVFCIVVMLLIGVIVFAVKWTNRNQNEMEWIRQEVETLLGSEVKLLDASYRKALDWMMYQDPLRMDLGTRSNVDSGLFQRFILAYFYFATSIDAEWVYCAPAKDGEESQCSYLPFDSEMEPLLRKRGNRWLSDSDACEWTGVHCNANKEIEDLSVSTFPNAGILFIFLWRTNNHTSFPLTDSFKLSGTFPDGIQYLSALTTLNLIDSNLKGPLPPNIILHLPQLTSLRLNLNQFTGSIPSQWFVNDYPTSSGISSPSLVTLELNMNLITGTIPPEMAVFRNLRALNLDNNRFEGTLPNEVMGGMPSLTSLQVSMNNLNGTIPRTIGQLTNLHQLTLTSNKLDGTIPSEIGMLKESLRDLEIGSNDFSGELPNEFYELTWLSHLELGMNRFNGTLKPTIARSFPSMTILKINQNEFTGSIPDQMETMPNLKVFIFSDNDLTGTIPEGLCLFVSERCCRVSCCTVDGDDCPSNITGGPDP